MVPSEIAVVPRGAVPLDEARSLANWLVVQGAATRDAPPVDEVLAYFQYGTSPFYAVLPAEATLPAPAGKAARWLAHRAARAQTESQLAVDAARLDLLRELYDEAKAQEKLRRGGSSRGLFGWGS